MDHTDDASAIDDSFFPIQSPQPRIAEPASGGSPITYEAYNGPRSGHWTVASTVNGSGIDDRVPTVHGAPAVLQDEGPCQVKKIDGSVLRRLAIATDKQKKAEEEEKKVAIVANESMEQGEMKVEKEKKGFYVPRLEDTRGICIKSRTGRKEIVKEPTLPPPKPLATISEEKAAEKATAAPAPAPSPPMSVRSGSAVSRTTNLVRIVGKNGEKEFVELPVLPRSSRSISAGKFEVKKPYAPPASLEKAEKARRDAAAAEAARKLKEERKTEDARIAAEAMMSGALPPSSKSSVASSIKQSSSKASGEPFAAVFDKLSKAPSVASSTTTVTQPSRKQKTVPKQKSKKSPSGPSKSPPNAGMQEVGWATYEPAVNKTNSRSGSGNAKPPSVAPASNSATPEHSFHGGLSFEDIRPNGSQTASGHSIRGMRSVSQHSTFEHSFNGGQGLGETKPNNYQSASVHTVGSQRSASQHNTYEHSFHGGSGFQETGPNEGYAGSMRTISNHHSASPHNTYEHSFQGVQHITPKIDFSGSVHTINSQGSPSQRGGPQHSMHRAPEFFEVYPGDSVVHTISSDRAVSQQNPQQYPMHDTRGFQDLIQSDSNQGSVHTISSHRSAAPLDQSPRQPTVFAGRGWISPHPLSEPPSGRRRAPDAEIVLPAMRERGPRTLSYEEYRAMQADDEPPMENVEARHRNISITESSREWHYEGGSWGRRGSGLVGSYRAPTVENMESVEGGRRESVSSMRQGNMVEVVEEVEDGNVQLRMPWDDQEGWW